MSLYVKTRKHEASTSGMDEASDYLNTQRSNETETAKTSSCTLRSCWDLVRTYK